MSVLQTVVRLRWALSALAMTGFACGGAQMAGPAGSLDAGGDASSIDAGALDAGGDAAPSDAGVDAPAPLPVLDGGACAFDRTYGFGPNGGEVAYQDQWTLQPSRGATLVRTRPVIGDAAAPGPLVVVCHTTIPACDATDAQAPTLSTLVADFRAPDVQAAFAAAAADGGTPFVYGYDERPVDGTVLVVSRDDGRAFAVGVPCLGRPSCTEIPAGLATLAADLQALAIEETTIGFCSTL